MKRAQIIKNGIVTNQAQMEEAELLVWLEKGISENWFGKAAHSYEELVSEEVPAVTELQEILNEEGLSFDPPQFEEVEISPLIPAVYQTIHVPAEYEVVITDITSELEQQRINQESQAYLDSTDWLIIRELDEGTPCPLEIKQARAEARSRIVKP